MKICLVGSILRHTIESDKGSYSGWGGMTESAVAPFVALLDRDSTIYFVGSVGKEDIDEIKLFFKQNYPLVDTSGIFINSVGTDYVIGTKHSVKRTVQVEPTRYEHIEPYIHDADVVIFNFGNIDDIDPEAIIWVKKNSHALVYVDVHRKPFGADENGYMYTRGWPGWEKYLKHADVVQMDKNECEALFGGKVTNLGDAVSCAKKILDIGTPQVLLTLGSRGVLVANRSDSYKYTHAPIVSCNVMDTTGCGDAFAAGYLVKRHEGGSLTDAIKMASLMGSINCEYIGYMRNINRDIIEKRLPVDFNYVEIKPKSNVLDSILV